MKEPMSLTAHDLVERAYWVGDESEPEIEDFDLEQLCALRNFVDDVARAARLVKKAVEERIARELGEGGAVRYGDQFIKAGPGKEFVVKDPEAIVKFAGADLAKLVNVKNSIRVTSLKSLLIERGHEKDFIDTFGDYEDDGKPLTVQPIDKAPKYAQKLEHGQRTFPKGKTLEEAAETG